jgi:hypothetical protein
MKIWEKTGKKRRQLCFLQIVAAVEELEFGVATSHIARLDQHAEK